MPGTMQAHPTPPENPSRRLGGGMLNTTNYANGSGVGLHLPSAAAVTVAANGNFVAPQVLDVYIQRQYGSKGHYTIGVRKKDTGTNLM